VQVSIEVAVTIGLAVFSGFCVLIKMVRSADMKRIEDLEKTCVELRKAAARLPVISETVEARKAEIELLQRQIDALSRRQDDTRPASRT